MYISTYLSIVWIFLEASIFYTKSTEMLILGQLKVASPLVVTVGASS